MTNELALAMEALYDSWDFDKRQFLSFRYSGFGFIEACTLAEVAPTQVKNWLQEDGAFAVACKQLIHNGKEMRKLIHQNLRDRNERLFLELDGHKLAEAMGLAKDAEGRKVEPTRDTMDYLKRARGLYTGNSNQSITQVFNIEQLIQERYNAKRPSNTDNNEVEGNALE